VAKVILVGADVALLEGLAQTLLGLGHDVLFATTIGDATAALHGDLPAIAVVSAEALENGGLAMTLGLTPGGALIVYGKSHAEKPFLPPKLQRATLAYLVLPLERHRLVALVQSFESRSRTTGRSAPEVRGGDFEIEL
jgi:DNA-binding response OmpR family regulator